jgi:cytosine/adenosine deaminase-related metal-dependent hydrolase
MPRDLLAMATADGAAAAQLDDRTGSLTEGHRADLIVVDATTSALAPLTDPYAALLLGAHPGLVRDVVVDGVLVKEGGRPAGPAAHALPGALDAARRSLDHLRRAAPHLLAPR